MDLALADQLRFVGRTATLEFAHLSGIRTEMAVLDARGGPRGAARTLASEFGCRAAVLDLTRAFCCADIRLMWMADMADRVTFHQRKSQYSVFCLEFCQEYV